MPKLSYNPVDRSPAPSPSMMAVKLLGMGVMVVSLVGISFLLARFSGQGKKEDWNWDPKSVRENFEPIYTPDQLKRLQREAAERAFSQFGVPTNSPTVDPPRNQPDGGGIPVPFGGNEPDTPLPEELRGVDQRDLWAQRDALHLRIAQDQLKKGPAIDYDQESRGILDLAELADADRARCMGEFDAYGGRQAPPNERLALQLLRKLPGAAGYADKVERNVFFFGPGQVSANAYRWRAFAVEGRLFDLYEVKLGEPLVMPDGASVGGYFEGVIALLGQGVGSEHPVEQRLVLFQALTLPDALKEFVNSTGKISHGDKLAGQAVMVRLTGVYHRLWVYSREVSPFSTQQKPVLSQAHLPLLLSPDVALSDAKPYELTEQMLGQVRDAMREDPIFLESEAAYYALLAKANDPQDVVKTLPDVGYFDLAGGGGETGPRYRGQGIRVAGMIGDDYAPVILPPNISGLRRVFRTLLLGDTADFLSPKKYLLDMIEPPTGLEPRALVGIDARYYRNVFEVKSTSSDVRPLLIVRRATPLREGAGETDWVFVAVGTSAFLVMFAVVLWFVMADRRERKAFEATSLELSRKRLERRGGLKLKPLPGDEAKPPAAVEKPPDPPAPA
ncbi:MAG: hypothetical protein KF754_02730 [Planctomycetes bacterium]|nr:hypothetical protein [Planctomycetota bacterium]